MKEKREWACYPDIETDKLKEEVLSSGVYISVEPSGIYLVKDTSTYPNNYDNLLIIMDDDPKVIFNYRNFKHLPQKLDYGTADLPLNSLTWHGKLRGAPQQKMTGLNNYIFWIV